MITLEDVHQKKLNTEIKFMVNERLYKNNQISKEMYEAAKTRILSTQR